MQIWMVIVIGEDNKQLQMLPGRSMANHCQLAFRKVGHLARALHGHVSMQACMHAISTSAQYAVALRSNDANTSSESTREKPKGVELHSQKQHPQHDAWRRSDHRLPHRLCFFPWNCRVLWAFLIRYTPNRQMIKPHGCSRPSISGRFSGKHRGGQCRSAWVRQARVPRAVTERPGCHSTVTA